jgi:predicted ester cyclase
MGIPATGARVTVTASGLFRLSGGRIVESWDHFDALGLLRQLGAEVHAGAARSG